ncbi:MAG: competence protein ComEC family protein [Bacteroidales bacterium]|nr:competence protein ComEC family protein [Bacteroidales bacterium]
MNWHKYPFVRFLLALAIGILAADWHVPEDFTGLFWVLAGMFVIVVVLHHVIKEYRRHWVMAVMVIAIFVLVGYLLRALHEPNEVSGEEACYLAYVYEPPVEREKTVKVLLELRGVRSDTSALRAEGRVVAYLQKDDEALGLSYGDRIAFKAAIEEVPPPMNPDEFDYRRYLRRQGVTGRVYLKSDDWQQTGIHGGDPLFAFASRFRNRLLEAMKRNGVTEDEFGVGAAVLLGYDESLSPEMRQHYTAAGSMHILCVSGMHVGIIYLLASYVLGFVGKGKKMARVRRCILLALIWFYALLTGLSPSIMRSALMISMVILGELTRRKGVLLNSIAASAFVLLLINPCNLFSIGFQLSYAAVVGIVLLQRPIYLLIYIKGKFLDKVWEITTVSLAAQVATMPFTVYYFNQFTPYFWLSNLVMTPLSFLVILTGMLLLLLSWIPGLNLFMGKIVWASLRVMNISVACVDYLPWSLVKGLSMSRLEFFLALLMLLLLCLFVALRKKRMLLELLVVACVFSASLAARARQASVQNTLLVYSLKNHTAIDLIRGPTHVLLCDEELLSESSTIDYSLKGTWACRQLNMDPPCYTMSDDMDVGWAVKQGHLLSFQGTLMAFYDSKTVLDTRIDPIAVDYLMVCGKQRADLTRALNSYRPSTLLVDASVPSYLEKDWLMQAKALNIPCFCLSDGFFQLEEP